MTIDVILEVVLVLRLSVSRADLATWTSVRLFCEFIQLDQL